MFSDGLEINIWFLTLSLKFSYVSTTDSTSSTHLLYSSSICLPYTAYYLFAIFYVASDGRAQSGSARKEIMGLGFHMWHSASADCQGRRHCQPGGCVARPRV